MMAERVCNQLKFCASPIDINTTLGGTAAGNTIWEFRKCSDTAVSRNQSGSALVCSLSLFSCILTAVMDEGDEKV